MYLYNLNYEAVIKSFMINSSIMKLKEEAYVFEDRAQAGRELAKLLLPKYKNTHPLILGVPRGGVEVAFHVAQLLHADLHVIISKKLPFPGSSEYGFGAVAEDGSVYIANDRVDGLSPITIHHIVEKQLQEIRQRIATYRNGAPLPNMMDKTVILIDDGIATGVTLVPLVQLCRKRKVGQIIIATPVAGKQFDEKLYEADAVEILVKPEPFYAVGQVYEEFGDFPDKALLRLLEQAHQRSLSGNST